MDAAVKTLVVARRPFRGTPTMAAVLRAAVLGAGCGQLDGENKR
jgi:hypothetical protein